MDDKKLFDLELTIAKILRYGVLLAGFFIFVGWMMQISWSGNPFTAFRSYSGDPLQHHLGALLEERSWGLLLSYFGLALLIALPFIRVVMTAFLFIRQKEYALAYIAGLVLFGLVLSISLGFEI